MRREKTAGAAKRRMLFSMLLAVCLMIAALPLSVSAAGGICAREPPLVGLPKPGAVGPAGRSGLRR